MRGGDAIVGGHHQRAPEVHQARLRHILSALTTPATERRAQDSAARPQATPAMHSSGLRSEDFTITVHNGSGSDQTLELPAFLAHHDRHTRVGIVAPSSGTEAAGAATMILAMITAFYNELRANDPPVIMTRSSRFTIYKNPIKYSLLLDITPWPGLLRLPRVLRLPAAVAEGCAGLVLDVRRLAKPQVGGGGGRAADRLAPGRHRPW
jgi:hypothetical protein